jgi:cytidylate kinase
MGARKTGKPGKASVSGRSGRSSHTTDRTHIFLILAEAAAAVFILAAVILTSGRRVREDVTLSELETAVFSEIGEGNAFSPRDAMALRKYYGLDAAELTDFSLCLPSSNMDAAELLIVVMKDESQEENIQKAMETRLANQIGVFESYGVDQMRLLNQAEIITEGRYAVFICAENAAKAGAAVKRLLLIH